MKYCPKCDVNVHHQQKTCPLCGQYLDARNDQIKYQNYQTQDQVVKYPILKEKAEVAFFKSRFNVLLLATMIFLIIMDFLQTNTVTWSQYTTIGIIFVLTCVMLPINRKFKLVTQIKLDLFVVSIVAILLELVICNWKFQWFVVEFVLPWIYVASLILVDFLLIFRRRKTRLFSTLLYCTFFSLLPQISLWIASACDWYQSKTSIDSIIFFACLLHFVVVAVVLNKYLKEEMERRLNM